MRAGAGIVADSVPDNEYQECLNKARRHTGRAADRGGGQCDDLLIDSYDSFSYNLVQAIGSIDTDIRVVRNDELTLDEIRALHPDRIVLSPGPGRPENAGVIVDVARELNGTVPMLGVCLGHQAICQAYGATITYARRLMHGKQSPTELDPHCPLFAGCAPNVPVARYHSLAVDPSTLPLELK